MESSDLNALVKQRGYIKGRLTKFKNFLNNLSLPDVGEAISEEDLSILNERLEKIKVVSHEFDEVQGRIEVLDEDVDQQIENRENFESEFYTLIGKANVILKTGAFDAESSPRRDGSVEGSVVTQVGRGGRGITRGFADEVKLPRIDLPKFNGDFNNWLEFRDTFRSLIHESGNLGNIQKFHYLRATLEGNAAQVIHSLEFSAENYVAWESLCDRFNNTRLLVDNHLKKLFSISVMNAESAIELRKLGDTITKHLRALELLGQPIVHWDTLIIFNMTSKLDKKSLREWEEFKSRLVKDNVPTLKEFKQFLRNRADLLETIQPNVSRDSKPQFKVKSLVSQSDKPSCPVCSGTHLIYSCSGFLKLSINDRVVKTKELQLCLNCLKANHYSKNCMSSNCRHCKGKHHTLLHFERVAKKSSEIENKQEVSVSMSSFRTNGIVLMSTVRVLGIDTDGDGVELRAVLDSASQSNFISQECCAKLGLPKSKANLLVTGIGQVSTNISECCRVEIQSCANSFKTSVKCYILPQICETVPSRPVDVSHLTIPPNIRLADAEFFKPAKIDLLLGAELFYQMLCVGQYKIGGLVLQKTKLGWVISGLINQQTKGASSTICNLSVNTELQNQIAKFWEIEEVSIAKQISNEESAAEKIFVETVRRLPEGRFLVTIPLKQSVDVLGDSYHKALKRFSYLEHKLSKDAERREKYTNFIMEYVNLDHMSRVEDAELAKGLYYLPHHGVVNEASTTTKLRVVFDASSCTSSGVSFNNLQLVGPTIQDELFSIILRFREHRIVVCGDIAKMYRQVLVNPEQRDLQRILWRENASDPIQEFRLNTVTYGTASAPFLAIRCLFYLADEYQNQFPKAAQAIKRDFYVDDFISGGDSIEEVVLLGEQVRDVLKQGCFKLTKWKSNRVEVISGLNAESQEGAEEKMSLGEKEETKMLGFWKDQSDVLTYQVTCSGIPTVVTKRSILSQVASIFDPLSLVGPCIVVAKIIIQELWLLKVSWDESVPSDLHTKWMVLRSQFSELNSVEIPRRVINEKKADVQLHAFCDASTRAYGACVYLRSESELGDVQISLLCSKSRVAPLKSLTIPRLELCIAVLLIQLVEKVLSSIRTPIGTIHFWSDSTVALCWIQTYPHQLQPFVSHRVAQIQAFRHLHIWHHVRTNDNPADVLSRGASPRQLKENKLWWQGPRWLAQGSSAWPSLDIDEKTELPELKKAVVLPVVHMEKKFAIERFSSLLKLRKTAGYCERFIFNIRNSSKTKRTGPLTVEEITRGFERVIKIAQEESFAQELIELKKGNRVASSSPLLKLNPFLDQRGVIRVGGKAA